MRSGEGGEPTGVPAAPVVTPSPTPPPVATLTGPGGYVGPQMVYEKGQRHCTGWQALDYARRWHLRGGDYTRQRHQQQPVRALVGRILDQDLARRPERGCSRSSPPSATCSSARAAPASSTSRTPSGACG
ncbi:LCP family glycopolymer transferase [Micromonospora fluostatini]|uniref:LCP family glycopolymer transferase n=1 Tax=Micromonospora sp. JCM 30529 TaxID=3421643 RepID=UPI003D165DBE